MRAGTLLSGARRGAGLSQRELARRAGVPQASVSRIERGVVSPSVDMLDRLLSKCGLEVEAVSRPGEGVDRTLITEALRRSPRERIIEAERQWRDARAFQRAIKRDR